MAIDAVAESNLAIFNRFVSGESVDSIAGWLFGRMSLPETDLSERESLQVLADIRRKVHTAIEEEILRLKAQQLLSRK